MGFKMPELIIESIIRDGFKNARRDPAVIPDVFEDLTYSYASRKYGQGEIDKIQKIIQNKEVSIVHAFSLVSTNLPCISIQLADDKEDFSKAHMGNYIGTFSRPKTSPEDLAALVIVSNFTPSGYDPKSGTVRVPDSVNLSQVYANLLFVDAAGTEHRILGGINNEAGEKQFIIAKQSEVDLGAGAEIKSSINYFAYTRNANTEQTQVIIGIHTQDALLTKYLYTLVKYFLLSRREDVISRGLQLATYQGSDFSRNVDYAADMIFTRFLHISANQRNSWTHNYVDLVDRIDVNVKIEVDQLSNANRDISDATISTTDDE